MFDTKVALIVRNDLAVWQKLNVVAFLATGIVTMAPEAVGAPYVDGAGRHYGRMLGQPVLVFAADRTGLQRAFRQAWARDVAIAPYVSAMFATSHDADNRDAFAADDPDDLDLVGLGLRGAKKAVDKATKGLALHE